MLAIKIAIRPMLLTVAVAAWMVLCPSREAAAQEPELSAAGLVNLQRMIKPQPGESRWMEVPWFLDLHEARQKAAAEGKLLFIYSSGGATGIGAC